MGFCHKPVIIPVREELLKNDRFVYFLVMVISLTKINAFLLILVSGDCFHRSPASSL